MGAYLASGREQARVAHTWIPIAIGLLCLYLPTYVDLYRVFWRTREGAYGPVILAFCVWLIWKNRLALKLPSQSPVRLAGAALFAVGFICFVLGRSQSFYNLEVASQVPLLLGVVCLVLGKPGLRSLWFPILMLVFVVPIPGSLMDQILLPLKELVSRVVDNALYLAGYPIARNGVVLMIGPYSLLIADACAGLNSIIAISGIGLIYIYLTGHTRVWLNVALLLSVVPIAFLANVVRVMALVLVTFYFGDSTGAEFHEQAGYMEIGVAFACFFALDSLVGRLDQLLTHSRAKPT